MDNIKISQSKIKKKYKSSMYEKNILYLFTVSLTISIWGSHFHIFILTFEYVKMKNMKNMNSNSNSPYQY